MLAAAEDRSMASYCCWKRRALDLALLGFIWAFAGRRRPRWKNESASRQLICRRLFACAFLSLNRRISWHMPPPFRVRLSREFSMANGALKFTVAAAFTLLGCERWERVDVYADLASKSAGRTYEGRDYNENTDRSEALDEAKGGRTLRGTPVARRTAECFPAEPRDLFWQMDQVASGPNGELQPLNFDENGDGQIDDEERDAIRGRNTWLLWGGGNEAFWGWLQEQGYGFVDFLILLDSRRRGSRFAEEGLINQPGFTVSTEPILGLYLDRARDSSAILRPPPGPSGYGGPPLPGQSSSYDYDNPEPELYDAQRRLLTKPVHRLAPPARHFTQLFEPWTTAKERAKEWTESKQPGEDPYKDYVPEVVRQKLPQDGLDPAIYGYPSGIFGLRLMLNPDFFGKTAEAANARAYWKERVEGTNGRYYTDFAIHADPHLVRPFRVSMSCGYCHVGPHPLNPPADPENPKWENLSSIIGDQYWRPQPAFGNLLTRTNFLHHFLGSQPPGTIDTSLISTDQLNNTNIINAIFDVPARLNRAMEKPTEKQSPANLLLPSVEDPGSSSEQRHFPMVLFPGEDSVGVFGALARVYLNIGVFSEQWARCDNPIIGFTPQRPFSVEVCRKNSVYWNVNERYRVGYMARFFTLGASGRVPKSTESMKLRDAGPKRGADGQLLYGVDGNLLTEGKDALVLDSHEKRVKGREVFLQNCAICHSSKQPPGFDLRFEREIQAGWDKAPVPKAPDRFVYTLPMEFAHWEQYKRSPAYEDYRQQIAELAGGAPESGGEDDFIEHNYLSNELRIPVTLVGTNSARAMATNAIDGNVWDNYSSETFKALPSVGKIQYFNPFSNAPVDAFGNNAVYDDGRERGGPGYLRPPSLISLWATAPYFHNNALGIFDRDVKRSTSVQGHLAAFDDGIRKLLWNNERPNYERHGITYIPPGDLRGERSTAAKNDPGYIYRLPVDTYVIFSPKFIRPLIEGILIGNLGERPGRIFFSILSLWGWVFLVLVGLIFAFFAKARHAGVFLLVLAALLAAVLAITGMGGYGGTVTGSLMMGATNLLERASGWLWLAVAAVAVVGVLLLVTRWELKFISRSIFLIFALLSLWAGILAHRFLNGQLKDVHPAFAWLPNSWHNAEYKGINLGPIPRGTPVDLFMNLDPEKRDKVGPALVGLLRACAQIKEEHLTGERAYRVIAENAGPALLEASKCPDFVLDRGHWFGESLTEEDKEALIAFLKTL
jgi:hypothetical protein